jgi:hypothetical protein
MAGEIPILTREREAIAASPSTGLRADEIAKKRKLVKIDKAIAVAKSPVDLPIESESRPACHPVKQCA